MNFVKIIFVALCFVYGARTQNAASNPVLVKIKEAREICIKENGVDPELVRKAYIDGDFADNNNLKCYFKCAEEKGGNLDKSGKFDFTPLLSSFPESELKTKLSETLDKCKNMIASDPCQVAFDTVKCIRGEMGPMSI